jgi:AcrR family transcriptional regulator
MAARDVPGTGGPRSAGTRRAILDAARSAFAARGYEQTTIRAVAAAAGIDASMVMRYYGSKAGLFAAAATADLHVPDLRAVPAEGWGEVLVRHLVERWEDNSRDDELILLLRTAVTSEAVATQLQDVLTRLLTEPIAELYGTVADGTVADGTVADGPAGDGPAGDGRTGDGRMAERIAAERAAFIAAQLLGLALCRYILRQEPLASLPAAEVVAAVAPSVQRYLTLDATP